MRLGRVRPAGEPLPPLRRDIALDDVLPGGYVGLFVQSGTAALALALVLAKQTSDGSRTRVLLPAYGCPDLVAAVLYAGLTPELVDTAPDSPFLSHEHLADRLADDVVAVIGAHFLGFAEDINSLRRLCEPHGITVIEDSAQRLPGNGGWAPTADLVTMSFGRGKPAGGLGGGLLLLSALMFAEGSGVISSIGRPSFYPLVRMRRQIFNVSLRPIPYGFVSRLPFLRVGQTRYSNLTGIRRLDSARTQLALSSWAQDYIHRSNLRTISRLVDSCDKFRPIAESVPEGRDSIVSTRYPALCCDARYQEILCETRESKKWGITRMYRNCLIDIRGMPRVLVNQVEQARDFAARLVTFPTHSDANEIRLELFRALMDTKRN
ncbi:DegT/DnrJ/EryC1/StrS family aminotransferase [Lentisalinibacter sediminis]|uniref:DegT/DnrJ/EryC1/StrS family aminotransferase n=1 Tax=Lentisalinibacter sediminis TaxID=2992237 RepID=UPI0038666E8F